MACVPKFTPHPKSAPGDFYVVKGECLACGVPQVVAPNLVGWTGEKIPHCFWKKQPETPAELERAIAVLEAQELECPRYAGTDPTILKRVLSSYCDYPMQPPSVPEQAEPRPCHTLRSSMIAPVFSPECGGQSPSVVRQLKVRVLVT
jgi:hypothetical protein